MIHMELGPSTIVGVGLVLIGFILYFIKTKKPDVSRDYDLFFSSVGLLCGGILIFQGWRLDPILLLCQILSSATAIFFIGESLWLRGTKSKNMNLFTPRVPYGKKQNVFLPMKSLVPKIAEERASDMLKVDRDFSSHGPLNKRVFFANSEHEDKSFQEKAFMRLETHKVKSIMERSQQDFVNSKKRTYQEKKISMYNQLKNKKIDFEYTDPIDYCHITFSTKD